MSTALAMLRGSFSTLLIQASEHTQGSNPTPSTGGAVLGSLRRRNVMLQCSVFLAATEATDSRTLLLQKYLKKSEDNKVRNDKERLESYYKRNYKDYFDLIEGSLRGKDDQQLSESEKDILDWLQKNK